MALFAKGVACSKVPRGQCQVIPKTVLFAKTYSEFIVSQTWWCLGGLLLETSESSHVCEGRLKLSPKLRPHQEAYSSCTFLHLNHSNFPMRCMCVFPTSWYISIKRFLKNGLYVPLQEFLLPQDWRRPGMLRAAGQPYQLRASLLLLRLPQGSFQISTSAKLQIPARNKG